jgi:hypothetical protein
LVEVAPAPQALDAAEGLGRRLQVVAALLQAAPLGGRQLLDQRQVRPAGPALDRISGW